MLVIKAIGLMVCIVVARRWKRARLPLVMVLLLGAFLLRGLQCGHEWTMDPRHLSPGQAADGLLGPTFGPKSGGPINPWDCPDPKNCIPPKPPGIDAGP